MEKAENQEELEPDNELLSQLEDVLKNPNKYSNNQPISSKEEEIEASEESSDDPVSRLLKKYGFEHLIGKSIEEILEELVLMPPSERPEGFIQELDALINGTSSKSMAESSKKEEEIAKDKIATSMPRFTAQMEAQVATSTQVSHDKVAHDQESSKKPEKQEPPKQAQASDAHSRTQPPKEKEEEEKVLRLTNC